MNNYGNGVPKPRKTPTGKKDRPPILPAEKSNVNDEVVQPELRPGAIKRLTKIVDSKLEEKEDLFSEETYRDRFLAVISRILGSHSSLEDSEKVLKNVIRTYVVSILDKNNDAVLEGEPRSLDKTPARDIFEAVSKRLQTKMVEHMLKNRTATFAGRG